MGFTFEIAGAQIDGARDYQEDAFLISHLGDSSHPNAASLIIVADGMGGHAAGNVASNLAVQIFNKHVTANFPTAQYSTVLRESVEQANNAIAETIRETAALKGMGCTLVGAIVEDERIFWVSVGDSHIYLLRDGELSKKNADHSYGGFLDRMAAEGKEIEPESGYSRSMLMSALTGEEIADIDCPDEPLRLLPGDRILLASDGLDTLSAGQLIHHAKYAKHPKELIDALLAAVEESGMPRQDNTTIVAIDVVGDKTIGLASPDIVKERPARATADALAAPDLDLEPKPKRQLPRNPALQTDYKPPPKQAVYIPPKAKPKKKSNLSSVISLLVLLATGAGVYVSGVWRQFVNVPGSTTPVASVTEDAAESSSEPEDAVDLQSEPAESSEAADEPESVASNEPRFSAIEEFRDTLKGGGEAPIMVALPGGSFEMGSPSISLNYDERPRHEVTLSEFAISRTEITIADYERFARATGRRIPDTGGLDKGRYPVFSVTWNDAVTYARWLSQQTNKIYRLPTEAEWEYAAGAGITSPYPWGYDVPEGKAQCFSCNGTPPPDKPAPVGSFDSNPVGISDAHGNVAEWVQDCYTDSYADAPTDGSARESGDCGERVIRGGSFRSAPASIRTQARDKLRPDRADITIGIRLVRER
jgi:formylglycine-generating enzyme required for sulfatase activity/serine/threonine protein phosphatase PrpC